MTCENDSGSTPEMAHAINEEISESEMVIVPELKHLGLLEEPGIFINSLQVFLDRYWRSLPL